MTLVVFFLLSTALSLVFVPVTKWVARHFGVLDRPDGGRKRHTSNIPLLGGVAVWASFVLSVCCFLAYGHPDMAAVPPKFFVGILLSTAVLVVGGVLDDKYNLSARGQVFFPALASLIVILCGIGTGITFVTSPVGGKVWLDWHIWSVPASGLFSWLWLMGMTYTTKILDGLDGLASGIGAIGAGVMVLLALAPHINQPTIAVLSVILFGSLFGFLWYGFYPASVFLGESGSTLIGFLLGVLAIITGAKIATALLVMAVPIIDVAWSILRRLKLGQSPFRADRGHLHHLLLDAGLSQRQVVLYMYTAASAFGLVALFLETAGKAVVFAIVVFLLIWILGWLLHRKPKAVV